MLAPDEYGLILKQLEPTVMDHHVWLEDYDPGTRFIFIAPEFTALDVYDTAVGEDTCSFAIGSGKVEFAIDYWDCHVVWENDDIFTRCVLDVVSRQQFFYFILQPFLALLPTLTVCICLWRHFYCVFIVFIVIFRFSDMAEVNTFEFNR